MLRKPLLFVLGILLLSGTFLPGYALEKLKFGTTIKVTPVYYLPVLAGEEKGFWKEQGLDVEWVPFRGVTDIERSVVAGSIPLGLGTATGLIQGVARGVPQIIVSDLQRFEGEAVYVLPNSPIKEPKELKGARIGLSRLGATGHAGMRIVAKALGIEKEVRYIAVGGQTEKLAVLRAGRVDVITSFLFPVAELRSRGQIRELLSIDAFRPKEWVGHLVFSHRNEGEKNPDRVKRVIRAIFRAISYIRQDPDWARSQMKKEQGYSDKTALEVIALMRFTEDGRIKRTALENVVNFLVEYGIVPKDKKPALEDIYTDRFLD